MAKCKCGSGPRIVSNAARNAGCGNGGNAPCRDVCVNPICGEPDQLSIFAPLVYDEIGINLCTTFDVGTDLSTEYPTATNASIRAINATYTYGAGNVTVEGIAGRPNCSLITLSNITVQFALNLYDDSCRLLDTIYPTAVYLPSDETAPTFDEDTNPTAVELELFVPYGVSYAACDTPTPAINYIGFMSGSNFVTQGINMYHRAKLLDVDFADDTVTVGLTFVLQSLYFSGYKVESAGRIETPKGSILDPEDSDCIRFVAGDLLDLAIKPLELGPPAFEESLKNDCTDNTCVTDCNEG